MSVSYLGFDAQAVPYGSHAGHGAGLTIDHHQAIAAPAHKAVTAARRSVLRHYRERPIRRRQSERWQPFRVDSGYLHPIEVKLKLQSRRDQTAGEHRVKSSVRFPEIGVQLVGHIVIPAAGQSIKLMRSSSAILTRMTVNPPLPAGLA